MEEVPRRRGAPSRISDTRVRWVPAVTNGGNPLSVAREARARPVQERARIEPAREPTRDTARRRGRGAPLARYAAQRASPSRAVRSAPHAVSMVEPGKVTS